MGAGPRFGVTCVLDDYDIMSRLNVDFMEILMRKDDSTLALERFLDDKKTDFIIHAPEKIVIDKHEILLDLASDDHRVRKVSIDRISEISEVAERYETPLVVHPGGVHPDHRDGKAMMKYLGSSLSSIDGKLWIENMPRRYHKGSELWFCNILTSIEDMRDIVPLVDGVVLDTA